MSDEHRAWARLCAEFHDLRLGANSHESVLLNVPGLRQWRDLVRETRAGRPDLAGWERLEAEVSRLNEVVDNFTLRSYREQYADDDPDDDRNLWADDDGGDEFVCAVDRCSRVEGRDPFGDKPRCGLFGVEMKTRPPD